ncbi:fimbrillin family protein [Bacteroides sp. 51]|uniref:fimbrillin family protein n=1 Tax=Bacteroides sp. 51 TaxID=2302938 RepID=UPI0013D1714D|nr:fimbrillin family protein [Bacteroides sp. 51]NDV84353.1 hypothetical protein [Bacteroides sp. 51]
MPQPSTHTRNKLLQLALPAVATLLLASCSGISTSTLAIDRVPVDLSLRIGTVSTRANGTIWNMGDAVGVFMIKKGNILHPDHILDNANNLRYLTTSSGEVVNLIPAAADQVMYYPVDASVVDFIAYYPYRDTGTGAGLLNNYIYPVRVDDQSDFSTIDLLYSTGSGNKSDKTVSLLFSHQLSKFRVALRKSAGLPFLDLAGTRVDLLGMPLASGFSLADQTFNYLTPSGGEEIGLIALQPITDGALYEALILPQPSGRFRGRGVGLTLPATNPDVAPYVYQWPIPDGTAFRSGKEYTYTFTLHGDGVEFGGIQINDWEDCSFEGAVVEMIDVPGGTFLMGSSCQADETIYQVTLTDFMVSRYPITNAQYAAYLNATRVAADGVLGGNRLLAAPHPVLTYTSGPTSDGQAFPRWQVSEGKDDYPVTSVTWFGANAFALWQGGSLPTEAQWEYACRLCDIHSNIWEWCLDSSGGKCILRSGTLNGSTVNDCFTGCNKDVPDKCDSGYGFRIVIVR